MKKSNLLVLLVGVALVAAVAVLAAVMPQNRTLSDDAPSLSVTHSPTPEAAPPTSAPAQTASTAAPEPAQAYLVVSVRGMLYEPMPLEGEGSFTIRQDENTTNTIHVTPSSIWMEHSTCDNQDCVDQVIVSLDNLKNRVLGNMIICLPNEVVLELHTPETLESTFGMLP